jgi:hypothetical protein
MSIALLAPSRSAFRRSIDAAKAERRRDRADRAAMSAVRLSAAAQCACVGCRSGRRA